MLPQDINTIVSNALQEDIGNGDITADLIAEDTQTSAEIISREPAILCGICWVDAVFYQLDPNIKLIWHAKDGDPIKQNQVFCSLQGQAKSILTGERTALNFLQSMSGTATLAQQFADRIKDLPTVILDTRKTIPGLRATQKYAVFCGGCTNHRMGLYDGILIKENHILACGSITKAVKKALKTAKSFPIEVEVETLDQLREALDAGANQLLLDNFDLASMHKAVVINNGQAKLEASGGITLENIRSIAETGVDYISVGALTKDVRAIDLSMRFTV